MISEQIDSVKWIQNVLRNNDSNPTSTTDTTRQKALFFVFKNLRHQELFQLKTVSKEFYSIVEEVWKEKVYTVVRQVLFKFMAQSANIENLTYRLHYTSPGDPFLWSSPWDLSSPTIKTIEFKAFTIDFCKKLFISLNSSRNSNELQPPQNENLWSFESFVQQEQKERLRCLEIIQRLERSPNDILLAGIIKNYNKTTQSLNDMLQTSKFNDFCQILFQYIQKEFELPYNRRGSIILERILLNSPSTFTPYPANRGPQKPSSFQKIFHEVLSQNARLLKGFIKDNPNDFVEKFSHIKYPDSDSFAKLFIMVCRFTPFDHLKIQGRFRQISNIAEKLFLYNIIKGDQIEKIRIIVNASILDEKFQLPIILQRSKLESQENLKDGLMMQCKSLLNLNFQFKIEDLQPLTCFDDHYSNHSSIMTIKYQQLESTIVAMYNLNIDDKVFLNKQILGFYTDLLKKTRFEKLTRLYNQGVIRIENDDEHFTLLKTFVNCDYKLNYFIKRLPTLSENFKLLFFDYLIENYANRNNMIMSADSPVDLFKFYNTFNLNSLSQDDILEKSKKIFSKWFSRKLCIKFSNCLEDKFLKEPHTQMLIKFLVEQHPYDLLARGYIFEFKFFKEKTSQNDIDSILVPFLMEILQCFYTMSKKQNRHLKTTTLAKFEQKLFEENIENSVSNIGHKASAETKKQLREEFENLRNFRPLRLKSSRSRTSNEVVTTTQIQATQTESNDIQAVKNKTNKKKRNRSAKGETPQPKRTTKE